MNLTESDKKFLLSLSRKALKHIFTTGEEMTVKEEAIPLNLREKQATFVTLKKKGKLRGCLGKLHPTQELYKDVIENTYSAAFADPRFSQLSKEELDDIAIEISVLGKPQEFNYTSAKDLLARIQQDKPGIILTHGIHTATFLPQVWKSISNAEEFLSQLCLKAGTLPTAWKNQYPKIQTYTVVNFSD
jgi:AmmeMemoRadiSam system protein A